MLLPLGHVTTPIEVSFSRLRSCSICRREAVKSEDCGGRSGRIGSTTLRRSVTLGRGPASKQIGAIPREFPDRRIQTIERLRNIIHAADPVTMAEMKWKEPSNPPACRSPRLRLDDGLVHSTAAGAISYHDWSPHRASWVHVALRRVSTHSEWRPAVIPDRDHLECTTRSGRA